MVTYQNDERSERGEIAVHCLVCRLLYQALPANHVFLDRMSHPPRTFGSPLESVPHSVSSVLFSELFLLAVSMNGVNCYIAPSFISIPGLGPLGAAFLLMEQLLFWTECVDMLCFIRKLLPFMASGCARGHCGGTAEHHVYHKYRDSRDWDHKFNIYYILTIY